MGRGGSDGHGHGGGGHAPRVTVNQRDGAMFTLEGVKGKTIEAVMQECADADKKDVKEIFRGMKGQFRMPTPMEVLRSFDMLHADDYHADDYHDDHADDDHRRLSGGIEGDPNCIELSVAYIEAIGSVVSMIVGGLPTVDGVNYNEVLITSTRPSPRRRRSRASPTRPRRRTSTSRPSGASARGASSTPTTGATGAPRDERPPCAPRPPSSFLSPPAATPPSP